MATAEDRNNLADEACMNQHKDRPTIKVVFFSSEDED
jgi:hypothetical protein